jgi:hypothetical protein
MKNITTFQSILNFMQSQDRNGTWLEASEGEKDYILSTLNEWINDGLEINPRIQGYIDYLSN